MINWLEQFMVVAWNRVAVRTPSVDVRGGVHLGHIVTDGRGSGAPLVIPHGKRAEHMLVLGRTGSGKSSLLRHMTAQDIQHDLGFIHIDLHGDTTPAVLRLIAAEERRRQVDLSGRVIVLEPADPEWAVGLNILTKT